MEVRNRRVRRQQAGMSQQELASKAHVAQGTVSSWERGFPVGSELEKRILDVLTKEVKKSIRQLVGQIGA